MRKTAIRGRLSLVWLLALAALLYTGVRFVREAYSQKLAAAEAFANGSAYEKPNIALTDLLK